MPLYEVPLLQPAEDIEPEEYARLAPLLLATLNSFAFDFVARQKIHGQTINLYILEQLPVPKPAAFDDTLGNHRIADFVREQVLRLSYTKARKFSVHTNRAWIRSGGALVYWHP